MGLTELDIQAINQGKMIFAVWEGSILVSRSSAEEYLNWLEAKGKQITGAEGFIFDGKNFTPVMECVQDYPNEQLDQTITFFKNLLEDQDWQTKPHFIEFTVA